MYSKLEGFKHYCKWLYLQYTLNTAIYTLNPNERMIFNGFVLITFSLAIYSIYIFVL